MESTIKLKIKIEDQTDTQSLVSFGLRTQKNTKLESSVILDENGVKRNIIGTSHL